MDTNSLDAMLDDAPTSQPAAQPVQQAEPAPQAAPEAPQGEKPDAAPPAAPVDQQRPERTVPLKAVEDERRKRQELEKKVLEYENMLRQQQQPKAEPPNWDLDPSTAAQSMQQQIQTRLYQQAVYTSERILRQQHNDYDEAATVFAEVARQDPRLAAQVFDHPFPAEFAYKEGKRIMLLREIGDDPEAYRSKLREQLMAEMGQGQPSQPQARTPALQAPVPKSLARAASSQPRDTRGRFAETDGPAPLEDLIG